MIPDPLFIDLEYFKKVLFYALQGLNPYAQNPGVHPTCPPKERFEYIPFHRGCLFAVVSRDPGRGKGSMFEVHPHNSVFDL